MLNMRYVSRNKSGFITTVGGVTLVFLFLVIFVVALLSRSDDAEERGAVEHPPLDVTEEPDYCVYIESGVRYCEFPSGDVCYLYYTHDVECLFVDREEK